MRKRIVSIVACLAAVVGWARGVCQVRHPAQDAWATCVSTVHASGAGVARHAAVTRAETQLGVVDVLLAFDASAVKWLASAGKGTVESYARTKIEQMNACLENSRLKETFHFRLVGVARIASDLSGQDLGDVLERFVDGYGTATTTAALKVVPTMRESVGADVVSILVANGSEGTVGIGYSLQDDEGMSFSRNAALIPEFGDWAYSVCSIEACDDGLTILHEIAHNMGAGHPDAGCADPYSFSGYEWRAGGWRWVPGAELGPQLYSYSSGYYFWWQGTGYYTVMSYNYGGLDANGESYDGLFEPVACFSSPDLTWNGQALGTSVNDNRRTLLQTYQGVAQYRVSKKTSTETDAGDDVEEETLAVETHGVSGAFQPSKAVNGEAPYRGALYDAAGKVQGVVSLKIGKMNSRKGTARVAGTVTLLDGTRAAIRAVDVSTGSTPQTQSGIVVAKLGTLELTLGESGFYGELAVAGAQWTMKTADVGGTALNRTAEFSLSDLSVASVAGYDCLENLLPTQQTVTTAGTKWSAGTAAVIKYVRDGTDGTYVLTGTADAARPNVSALKLSYASTTGLFKGSFKIYFSNAADVAMGQKPKLKKYTVKVTGVVVDGIGTGTATCKKPVVAATISIRSEEL